MPSYRDQVTQSDTLHNLADLEDAYLSAQADYRAKDTPARRAKFKEAKQAFADAQREYRAAEEKVGRRTPGAAVAGGGR